MRKEFIIVIYFASFVCLHCVTVKHNHNLWRHFVQSQGDLKDHELGWYWNNFESTKVKSKLGRKNFYLVWVSCPVLPTITPNPNYFWESRWSPRFPIALHLNTRLSCFQAKVNKNVFKYFMIRKYHILSTKYIQSINLFHCINEANWYFLFVFFLFSSFQ